jgi:hypothetical protein
MEGRRVPGFAFLASIIAIFSGAQMFAPGIIGEYLARMHFRMMERRHMSYRKTQAINPIMKDKSQGTHDLRSKSFSLHLAKKIILSMRQSDERRNIGSRAESCKSKSRPST